MNDVKEMTLQEEYDLYKVIKEKQVLKLEKRIDNLLEAVEYVDARCCEPCCLIASEALEKDKELEK